MSEAAVALLALLLVVQSVLLFRFVARQSERSEVFVRDSLGVLTSFVDRVQDGNRNEREVLLRAVLTRNATEFTTMERAAPRSRPEPGRHLTKDEFDRTLAADFAGMNLDPSLVTEDAGMPEGL